MEAQNPFQASQTTDPEVRAYIYSLVTALGGNGSDETGQYVLGDDALECLRDIKKWLKLFDEKTNQLDVARCLAEARLVNGDLLPILSSCSDIAPDDRLRARIAQSCLELLVPLTWPLENDQMTANHYRHTPYIEQSQVLYKAGIIGHDTASILRIVVRVALPAIAMPRDERSNRDEAIIKLLLYFLRNVVIISQNPSLPSQGLENEVSRSATIEAFKFQDVFALLLTLCSNMGEDFGLQDVVILEILFHLVRGVDVEKLFMNQAQRKTHKTTELKDVLKQESGMHRDYRKTAPTRHGRFGTMIWVKRDEEKYSTVSGQDTLKDGHHTLAKMDESKKWNKPRQRKKHEEHSIQDFDRIVGLTDTAQECLRVFVEEFLDSGFNPLFVHLRKAIEREAERLLPINYRQYFYVVSWFLHAERARRSRHLQDHEKDRLKTDFEADSYGLVAGVLNQEMFITLNRSIQIALEQKDWQDLSAQMRCFTQILLTVQDMAKSPLEEDQEIADNIQSRIFYEESTHDRVVTILRDFKDQGFGYLDACTDLAHVFLRMLERYSKENVDLQIRSRRQARRKKRAKAKENGEVNEEGVAEQSEDEDSIDAAQISRERKFDFNRFAAKFTTQKSVDTFAALAKYYRELSVEQLKRCHRFFYRVAFKQELAVLLYRVDIFHLFYKMVKGPGGLDKGHEMFKEWEEFSRQLFKRLFKKLEERPEMIVEMLFSKISSTMFFLEFGHERQTAHASRNPFEVEVSARAKTMVEKIRIVIGALKAENKMDSALMVRRNLQLGYDERKSWEVEAAARKELKSLTDSDAQSSEKVQDQGADRLSLPPFIGKIVSLLIPQSLITNILVAVKPRSSTDATSITKHAKTRLLMTLCGFVQPDTNSPQAWHIPPELTSAALYETLQIVDQNIASPITEFDGEDPGDLIRRTKKSRMDLEGAEADEAANLRATFISDSEGSDLENEDFQFPDNLNPKSPNSRSKPKKKKTLKRKRDADTEVEPNEELLTQKRAAREEAALARRRKIKSDLYIRESDDETDDDADQEFFAMEDKRRREQEERVVGAMLMGKSNNENKGRKKNRVQEEDVEMVDGGDELGLGIGLGIALDSEGGDGSTSEEEVGDNDEEEEDSDKENAPRKKKRLQQKRNSERKRSAKAPKPAMSTTLNSSSSPSRPRSRSSMLDAADTETPLSSQAEEEGPGSEKQKWSEAAAVDVGDDIGRDITSSARKAVEEKDIAPTVQRRRVRAGFILDSDDDE
ncbi:MAG: hypothetical protein Q9227_007075 [Pyrenula ochraceoflavens]